MVTFRQVARTYVSLARAAERDRNRQAKESARLYKEHLKQNEIENATETIRRYEEYIKVLMSVHKNCANKIDWQQIIEDDEPLVEKNNLHEDAARKTLNDFTPSFLKKYLAQRKKYNHSNKQ
jgi:hypothetical protein